ncbi:hypothetical protein BKH43_03255 [Helicobacter sp. 13S00401-1]|uniref:TolC family protein n=1 Tax=Helicobacter sp. 13S00401-1 TaxID=1905758 RepID=UPI000BA6F291|nr:TolC family protein [Helicobacter sp. 13S00401-1]PAF50892.1 hypothetical protein BKH43_03255 [Helicobacter sp. 13S00401-1]
MMKLLKLILSILIASILAPSVLSALSMQKMVDLALNNTYKLEAQRYNVQKARSDIKNAYASFLPSINFGYLYSYNAPQDSLAYQQNNLQLTSSFNIFNGLKDYYGLMIAKSNYKQELNTLESTKNDLVLMTKIAYLKALENREALKISKDSIDLLNVQLKTAKEFYKQGIADKSDVLSIQVNIANAQMQNLKTKSDLDANLNTLRVLTGTLIDPAVLEDITVPTFSIDRDELMKNIYKNNISLQQFNTSEEIIRQNINLSRSGYYPKINISTSNFIALSDSRDNNILQAAANQNQVRLSLTWNFLDATKSFYSSQALTASLLSLNSAKVDLKEDILLQATSLINALNIAKAQINLATVALAQAKENYRIVSNKYKQQVARYVELLDSELLLTNAKSRLSVAKYELAISIARIYHLENTQF